MKARGFWILAGVTDEELVGSLRQLVRRSGWTEARIVAHLAEVEARRLHLKVSSSLFAYCTKELGLSQNEAFYRIQAARLARRFPILFELLERREVHLTAIALIRDYITFENHLELLGEVSGKTKEEILCLLAARSPRPDVKSKVRQLPLNARSVAMGPTAGLEPTSRERYCLQLCIGLELRQKLEHLLDLMSHSNPARDLAVAVERAVDTEIERPKKRRFGQRSRSAGERDTAAQAGAGPGTPHDLKRDSPPGGAVRARVSREPGQGGERIEQGRGEAEAEAERDLPSLLASAMSGEGSVVAVQEGSRPLRGRRHVPNEVRRQLTERDGLRCTYVGEDGKRCEACAFLQMHHDLAWAKNGGETLGNLRLLCAAHNALLAERDFGAACMASAIASARSRRMSDGG